MSNTAQRTPASHSVGWARNQAASLSVVLPPTMSDNCRPPTSTTGVHHCLVCHRPRRRNNVSSTPTASTAPNRSLSASSSASPQRAASLLTVCHPQPNSAATSWVVRPSRPTPMVTHLPAREVNNPRSEQSEGLVPQTTQHHTTHPDIPSGVSANRAVPVGRTPGGPPTPPSAPPWTTPARHNLHTPAGPYGYGSPPPAAPLPCSRYLPLNLAQATSRSHMCAGISFHRGSSCLGCDC